MKEDGFTNFELNSVIPLPNNWFLTRIEYEGQGRAEFHDPRGIIKGPVKIYFDEFGESNAEMEIQVVETEQSLRFGLMEFLSGSKPVEGLNQVVMGIGTRRNPCTKLVVSTPQGIFSATDSIHYGEELKLFGDGEGGKLSFHLLRSQFDVADAGTAKYWVIPLSNFVSEFALSHPDLDRHPLRIYPTPLVPDGLSEQDSMRAILRANQKNRLIVFRFNDSLGFIEPLPDFDDRKRQLLAGRERSLITAVMVGEVKSQSIGFDDLKGWFPFGFFDLLGLATGVEVGAPWIEFRDDRGGLVRRIHVRLGHSLFSRGHAAIHEDIHIGIGHLLTRAPASPHYDKSYLRVAIKNLIRGGLYSRSIEDRLSHLFRAFDGLCEEFQLKKPLTLDGRTKELVGRIIKRASKEIRVLAKQAENQGRVFEARLLRRIAEQVAGAKTVTTGFGSAVVTLLDKFGLHDAELVTAYYEQNPRPDGRQWPAVLSYYRGVTMHRSYFDVVGGNHEVEDLLRITKHLHDILTRIILKMLGYNGKYQPTVLSWSTDADVDWVKQDLLADQLGYE